MTKTTFTPATQAEFDAACAKLRRIAEYEAPSSLSVEFRASKPWHWSAIVVRPREASR